MATSQPFNKKRAERLLNGFFHYLDAGNLDTAFNIKNELCINMNKVLDILPQDESNNPLYLDQLSRNYFPAPPPFKHDYPVAGAKHAREGIHAPLGSWPGDKSFPPPAPSKRRRIGNYFPPSKGGRKTKKNKTRRRR